MDEETKARVLALLDRPLAELTFREILTLMTALDEHEDEIVALVPEAAAILRS